MMAWLSWLAHALDMRTEAALLEQPSTEYSAQMGGNELYVQVVVPPASKPGYQSELSLTITDLSGSLDWVCV